MIAATEPALQFRPRLLLSHPDDAFAAAAERHLQMLGWEIRRAHSADEVFRLTKLVKPMMIVLATETDAESGWLTCSKLVREDSARKVVLVAPIVSAEDYAFAGFCGASAIVRQHDGVAALVDVLHGTALPAAG